MPKQPVTTTAAAPAYIYRLPFYEKKKKDKLFMHFNAKAEVGPQSQNELLQPQNNELQQRQKK